MLCFARITPSGLLVAHEPSPACLMPLLVECPVFSLGLLPILCVVAGSAADTLIGVDLSEGMLEAAFDRGESGRLKSVRSHVAASRRLCFPDATRLYAVFVLLKRTSLYV